MQIHLSNTTHSLELITAVAGSIHYQCGYSDITSSSVSNPIDSQGIVTTATTTTIVAAPAASTTRKVQYVNVFNNGTAANTITLQKNISSTLYVIVRAVLQPRETLRIVNDKVSILLSSGVEKTFSSNASLLGTVERELFKVGTAPEGTGVYYSHAKDSGMPGAWSPGTPGINGRVTDGTNASDAGCINLGNPASGNWYVRYVDMASTLTTSNSLIDLLWVNTGIAVTTTTAQAISQPTLPARDELGTTDGVGVNAAILVTTNTTNAGAVTNTTLSYTNSDGVSGRTATISSFPTTCLVGSFVKFQLQAGDRGIRSIQSITLGTSYGGGAISLVLYRKLYTTGIVSIFAGANPPQKELDVPLYNGHCILPISMASSTNAFTISGSLYFVNK